MKILREHLSARLFAAFLSIVFIGMAVLALAAQASAPGAFARHMGSGAGMGPGGMGQGQGPMMAQEFFLEFRSGLNEALGWAALSAVLVAAGLSFALSRRIVAPLQAMTSASRRIAEGQYEERVQVTSADELGQLGASFNRMAAQLEQTESMRRQLIGDVSHELRTPLTAIQGSMEGLIDGVLPADAETFQQIHAEAERLSRLVDDLQELSRVEARAYELNLTEVELNEIVAATIKRLAPNARAKRVTLDANLPAHPRPIRADADRLGQTLTNLVSNAIQYTPEGGRVTLAVTQTEQESQIAVTDTGIGISPEHIKNIFTRFYRVDKSRSRAAGGGSGIGLTIARLLTEAHGGRIWAESEGEGKGSRFVVALPIKK